MPSLGGILLYLLVLSGPVLANNMSQYCSLCSDHTLCKYKGVGSACAQRIGGGITANDKSLIVRVHNELRQKVAVGKETRGSPGPQPQASNMRALSWDPELATIAQLYADQCIFEHDTCRRVPRFQVGQNLAWVFGPINSNWTQAILDWYNEVALYSKNDVNKMKFAMSTGHYTQLVWADTYRMGCGYTTYRLRGGTAPEHLYVCNYGPAGNFLTMPVYKIGRAVSLCKVKAAGNSTREFPGLCP